jgi:hypothetical protein
MAEPLLPPEIDPQDPLPDPSFTARRWMTAGVVGGAYLLAAVALARMPDTATLSAFRWALAGGLFAFGLYMTAASAKEVSGLLATLRLRLHGPRHQADADPTPSPAQAAATDDERPSP